eukprot:12474447-Prorocentrum_lima.AAC.1
MTSSLVGSEMCIRDSSNSQEGRFGSTRLSRMQILTLGRMLKYLVLKLSLIHILTLPTICSV